MFAGLVCHVIIIMLPITKLFVFFLYLRVYVGESRHVTYVSRQKFLRNAVMVIKLATLND